MAYYNSTYTGTQLDAAIENNVSETGSVEYTDSTLADVSYCGTVVNKTAGENLVFGEICYIKSDGKLWKANATSDVAMPALFMAVATIAADAVGKFLRKGYVKDANFATLTIGSFVYVTSGSTGDFTQTAPTDTGANVQIIGIATATDAIEFEPNITLIELS
jgi:hypothetical protein